MLPGNVPGRERLLLPAEHSAHGAAGRPRHTLPIQLHRLFPVGIQGLQDLLFAGDFGLEAAGLLAVAVGFRPGQ